VKSSKEVKDWSDDARLTALALGELDGAERAELERELAEDAAGRAALAEIRALTTALEGELASELAGDPEAAAGLSANARAAITARAGRVRSRRRILARVGLAVGGLAAASIAAMLLWPESVPSPFRYDLGFGASTSEAARPASAVARASDRRDAGYTNNPHSTVRREVMFDPATNDVAELEAYLVRQAADKPTAADRRILESLGYSSGARDAPFPQSRRTNTESSISETYDPIVENPFYLASEDPLSTFSIDVDTASYANVRRYLNSGQLPPPDAVRIEELLNYFSYDYAPTDGALPFSITTEVTAAPWTPEHQLVRIGLRGDEIPLFEPKEKNLVFLIDVSGSMNDAAKLPLLKRSMQLLVDNLSARDRVGIVVYAGASGIVLEPTPCDRKEEIKAAIEALAPGGSTHASQGIGLAYALCEAVRAENGVNRVILATDGDFNVGVTSDDALVKLIEEKRRGGVSLSVLGFGTGNLKDSKMEKLADHGNGNYAYVDSLDEARKVLVREMGGTLETIAKDVKIQVEFDPQVVKAFRLIGYENRVLAHEDFANDAKDAGEIGAGHRVTALYEVVVQPRGTIDGVNPDLGVVRLRYKDPDGDASRLIERPLADARESGPASADLRFAAGVAAFGMVLRHSPHTGDFTLRDVYDLAFSGAADDPFGYRTELLRLVQRAIEIAERGAPDRR
jgi:Ca-activated chloride channel family protein